MSYRAYLYIIVILYTVLFGSNQNFLKEYFANEKKLMIEKNQPGSFFTKFLIFTDPLKILSRT